MNRKPHEVNMAEFSQIDCNWVAGFVAGDGSFGVKITKRGARFKVELRFRITQHIRDKRLLEAIALLLECGKVVVIIGGEACDLSVITIPDNTNKIIPFFNKHPIGTVKGKDFNDFVSVANLMQQGAHLTPKGLAKIRKIKSNMNNSRVNK